MTRDAILCTLASHASDLRRFGFRSLALFGSVARGDDRLVGAKALKPKARTIVEEEAIRVA